MKIQKYISLVIACVFLLCSAEVYSDTKGISLSAIGGKTYESINIPATSGVDFSIEGTEAFGLSVGFAFNDYLSLDVELIRGGLDFKAAGPRGTIDDDSQVNTTALYLTQRSDGNVYFKTKLGVIREEVTIGDLVESSDVGASYGIGLGYNLNQNLSFEFEYTKVEQDIAWIVASVRFLFGL